VELLPNSSSAPAVEIAVSFADSNPHRVEKEQPLQSSTPNNSSFYTRLRKVVQAIFGIDLRSLAALRIGAGLLLLVDLFLRAGDLTAHYSDNGVMPRSLVTEKVLQNPWCLSLHMMSGAAPVEGLLFGIAALCAFCFLIGFKTRLATITSWFLLLSLHNRNPMILQGGDVLLRMLLFWGMLLPLGCRWSVDHVLNGSPAPFRTRALSVGTIAILLQIAFMYWFSVLLKTDPVWFRDYTAVYYALSLDHFSTAFGKLLLPYHRVLQWLTWSTLWLEALGPVVALLAGLLKWPFRTGIILGFCAFHLGMSLCLNLGLFSWICCTAWLVFLPSGFWDWISHACSKSPSFKGRILPFLVKIQHFILTLTTWLPRARVSFSAPARLPKNRPGLGQTIAAFFLLYVFLWNVRTTNAKRFESILPTSLDWIGAVTGVWQMWDMFSPSPLKEDGWFVMPAQLRNGTEVDLFRNGAPVRWEKPELVSAMYPNDRWRKYMVLLGAAANTDWRPFYANYLCRRWNSVHPPAQQVKTMQIYLMEEDTLPNYEVSKPRPVLLWTHKL
jgi:hypothetical protein